MSGTPNILHTLKPLETIDVKPSQRSKLILGQSSEMREPPQHDGHWQTMFDGGQRRYDFSGNSLSNSETRRRPLPAPCKPAHHTKAAGEEAFLKARLADAGFARIGFRILKKDVREIDGRSWDRTNQDLDRLIDRDGVRYGVEIKNQLAYIDLEEFQTKLAMCRHFGVRPMFIARQTPMNYIRDAIRGGGFVLIMGNQHYPLLADDLATRVRERQGLSWGRRLQ